MDSTHENDVDVGDCKLKLQKRRGREEKERKQQHTHRGRPGAARIIACICFSNEHTTFWVVSCSPVLRHRVSQSPSKPHLFSIFQPKNPLGWLPRFEPLPCQLSARKRFCILTTTVFDFLSGKTHIDVPGFKSVIWSWILQFLHRESS